MKLMVVIGVILVVLGIVALIYQGIPYTSERDTVHLGPIQTSVETKKTFAIPPLVGGLMLAGGIVSIILGLKKKT